MGVLIKIGIDPVAATIGGLRVHWYGIMIAIGLYAGIQVALHDAPRRGIDRDKLMNVSLIAAVLGVVGGRLYYVVQNRPEFYFQHPAEILAVWNGGMAFYGAIFAGALALVIGALLYRLPLWSLFDVGALGLTIGQAFGRVGNIINGDIVGYRTDGSWGFVYTNPNTFAPRNVPVQPANLYELLIAVAIFTLLWSLRKRIRPEGMLAMLYLVLYSLSQLAVFALRDNVYVLGPLKQAQVTAIVVIALTVPFIVYLLRRQPRAAQPADQPSPEASRAGEVAG